MFAFGITNAQTKMYINKTTGTDSIKLSEIKSITFVTPSIVTPPKNGLIAWYKFDGNTADSSGNNNHGINNGAILTTDRFGSASKALGFNGSSSYVQIPWKTQLQPNAGSFSFCGWFKIAYIDTSKQDFYFLDMDDGDSDYSGYSIFWDNLQTKIILDFHYDDVWTHHTVVSSSSVTLKSGWHFFAGVLDRSSVNMQLYLDGTLVNSSPIDPQAITSTKSDLYFGRRPYIPSYEQLFNGSLDDIRIYNRALSAAEIQALYHENGW